MTVLVPIGVPLGRCLPCDDREYWGIRKAGKLHLVDREVYEAWWYAKQLQTPDAAASALAARWNSTSSVVKDRLFELACDGFMRWLSGAPADDWEAISPLRVIPIAAVMGLAGGLPDAPRYRIYSLYGHASLSVDPLSFNVWTYWDGATDIVSAVLRASADSHVESSVVRERTHLLLLMASKLCLVSVDDAPTSAEGR